ncbi:sensor histidine kinase [Paenibacillus sp. TRM 82003]|nr:sensor histidine kinase [Paenibacillus sp. TRM 82003]
MNRKPMGNRPKRRAAIPHTYKMMVPYLLLVLLTDLLIGFYSYSSLIASRTEMAETNLRTSTQQTISLFDFQMSEIQRISESLFENRSFNEALQKKGSRLEIYHLMLDQIIPALESPLRQFGNTIYLVVYQSNSSIMQIDGINTLQKPIKSSKYFIIHTDNVNHTDWYSTLNSNKIDGSLVQIDADKQLNQLSYVHHLISYQDYQTVSGYIRIIIPLDDLLNNFDSFPLEEGISVSLIEESSGLSIYQRGGANQNDQNKIVLKESVPGTNYAIKVLIPQEYLTKDSRVLQIKIATVCTISFLIMTAIGLFVARLSGRKMRHIVAQLHSFQEGSFGKRINFTSNDEFGHIADAFNAMAANIQRLIEDVYVEGLRKKEAELEALQAQINPHFLYNTLSSIISLVNMGEIQKATAMVRQLALFYRLTLNDGKVAIDLEKEVEQIKAYIDIQRSKYEDAVTVYYDIEPAILTCTVIKLILQPFVENIFKHAWFGDAITIIINGRKVGGHIELKVIDNGIGISKKTLQSIQSSQHHTGGYGIKNVNERIKLRYGKEYGVTISSIYGAGTTACILLPAERVSQENPAMKSQAAKGGGCT